MTGQYGQVNGLLGWVQETKQVFVIPMEQILITNGKRVK